MSTWPSILSMAIQIYDFADRIAWRLILIVFLTQLPFQVQAQGPYRLSRGMDLPLAVGSSSLFVTSLIVGRSQDPLTLNQIRALDRTDINQFDRGATGNYSTKSGVTSDVLRAMAWGFPFVVVTSDPRMRSDFKILSVLALETFFITSAVTNIVKLSAKRIRPFAYNDDVQIAPKLRRGVRRSFFSGHTSLTASFSFLLARIINDYGHNCLIRHISWGSAALLPAFVSYLRVRAGKHFPTDVMVGYTVGALIGYFLPKIHMMDGSSAFKITPTQAGLALTYTFN